MSCPMTATPPVSTHISTGGNAGEVTALPPYSHELDWPEGMAPFKVVDDGTQGDPYRHYQWMRQNAPVLRAHSPVSDVWFISRYDDVRRAMRAPKVFSSQVVDPVPLTFLTLFDAPNHTRLRRVWFGAGTDARRGRRGRRGRLRHPAQHVHHQRPARRSG
jgi:cytochrome P450